MRETLHGKETRPPKKEESSWEDVAMLFDRSMKAMEQLILYERRGSIKKEDIPEIIQLLKDHATLSIEQARCKGKRRDIESGEKGEKPDLKISVTLLDTLLDRRTRLLAEYSKPDRPDFGNF